MTSLIFSDIVLSMISEVPVAKMSISTSISLVLVLLKVLIG